MKNYVRSVLTLLVGGILISTVLAQGPGRGAGGGGGSILMTLLNNKSVIDELKLTDDQRKKLDAELKKVRDRFNGDLAAARGEKNRQKMNEIQVEMNRELYKALEANLKPEQYRRFVQVDIWSNLQNIGTSVISTNEKVKEALKLTEAQKAKLADINQNLQKSKAEAFQEVRGNTEKMQKFQETIKKIQEDALEKFKGTLTEEQKKAWKELLGEKFDFQQNPGR